MIVTFYSYKGGTGRTMALANIAVLLAQAGRRVLMVDFDLEAPGIWRYFADMQGGLDQREGLLDLLTTQAENGPADWRRYVTRFKIGMKSVSLMTSGRQDARYPARVLGFDWTAFFERHDGGRFIEELRESWLKEYDFVLVDSRTGITDIGGICTIALPDLIVPVFVANSQNVDGIVDVLQRAQQGRQDLAYDRPPALVLPLLSRFDSRTEFQFVNEWLMIAASRFGEFYADWLPRRIEPRAILERTKLPHVAYFGFGEKLAVLLQGVSDPDSLGYALNNVATLIGSRLSDLSKIIPEVVAPPPTVDRESATSIAPRHDSWIAAVHHGSETVGAAFAVDRWRVITAAHVAETDRELTVTFPKASDDTHYRVESVSASGEQQRYDVAMLHLAEPLPARISPAPLAFVPPSDLIGQPWWTFGFPYQSMLGATAKGVVDGTLSYGLLALDPTSRSGLQRGFSGSPVWSSEHEAVIGLVTATGRDGEGIAIPLHRVDAVLPAERLRLLGDTDTGAGALGPHQRGQLIELLGDAVNHEGSARYLLQRIGFPPQYLPQFGAFSSSELFWTDVVRQLELGVVEGGLGALVDALHQQYPGNRALSQIVAALRSSPAET